MNCISFLTVLIFCLLFSFAATRLVCNLLYRNQRDLWQIHDSGQCFAFMIPSIALLGIGVFCTTGLSGFPYFVLIGKIGIGVALFTPASILVGQSTAVAYKFLAQRIDRFTLGPQ